MNFLDLQGVVGVLTIKKIFAGSEKNTEEEVFKKKNLIVKASRQRILTSLYTTTTSDPIHSLKIGTGGTYDPAGMFVIPESINQTGLTAPVSGLSLPVSYSVSDTGLSVTFSATLDQSSGNGNLISEAGLFTLSGNIFNVKNHPGISKTSDFSLQYSWTITIS